MKEKEQAKGQLELFRTRLSSIIDLNHELCLLAGKIDWNKFEAELAQYFPSETGKPALPSRLIVRVLYLKYTYSESDENVVAKWKENPYWQYFCGM